jgi:hypothetical protein
MFLRTVPRAGVPGMVSPQEDVQVSDRIAE